MIKNPKLLEELKRKLSRQTPPDFAKNSAIVEALLAEAKLLGVWPPNDPMGGFEVDLRIAKILNSVHRPS
jgi:hypothetical protein